MSVVRQFIELLSMEADGAPFIPSPCQCSILRVFKATATQIREKLEQTLESLRIELVTSSTEGSALTNCATCLLLFLGIVKKKTTVKF